jgi:hypothetical protein
VEWPGTEFWTGDDKQGTDLLNNNRTLRLHALIFTMYTSLQHFLLGKLMNFLFQSRNSPHFTLLEDSLPSLQWAIVGRFSEPLVSVNIRPPYSLNIHNNITLI